MLSTVIYQTRAEVRGYLLLSTRPVPKLPLSTLIYSIYISRAAGMVVGGGQEENANDNGAAAAAGVQPEPRRGVSGLPRGVRPVQGKPGLFQARVSYKPADAARATTSACTKACSRGGAGEQGRAARPQEAAYERATPNVCRKCRQRAHRCPVRAPAGLKSQLSNSVPCALCLFNLLGFHLTTLVCRHLCVCVSAEFAALAE